MMVTKTREQLAIHEAGKAIVACALGRQFVQVSIELDKESGKRVSIDLDSACPSNTPQAQRLRENVLIGLAGAAAETTHANHGPQALATLAQDYVSVVPQMDALFEQSGDTEIPGARDVLILSLWERLHKMLNQYWGAVSLLSDLLLDLDTVSWSEAYELFSHTTRWRQR